MSLLDEVRERYAAASEKSESLESGTDKTDKRTSVSFVSTSPRDPKVFPHPVDLGKARQAKTARELRRARVLADLEAEPELKYALLVDDSTDPVTVAVAIRGAGSAELSIERDRYDGFELLRTIQAHDDGNGGSSLLK